MNKFFPYSGSYNYYGDESCHLLNDGNKYMALGALCCPKQMSKKLSSEIRDIKIRHGLSRDFEIKSSKVSMGAVDFYTEIIKWFIQCNYLKCRVVLINKNLVDNKAHHQTHNDFYYKMYYTLFRYFMYGDFNYIYLDYKDTQSYKRCSNLEEILNNTITKTSRKSFVSQINSIESNIMQLTDFLIGLICYNANKREENTAKCELIKILRTNLNCDLFTTTPHTADDVKIDILNWRPGKK